MNIAVYCYNENDKKKSVNSLINFIKEEKNISYKNVYGGPVIFNNCVVYYFTDEDIKKHRICGLYFDYMLYFPKSIVFSSRLGKDGIWICRNAIYDERHLVKVIEGVENLDNLSTHDIIDLVNSKFGKPERRLVGDISTGYYYVDTDGTIATNTSKESILIMIQDIVSKWHFLDPSKVTITISNDALTPYKYVLVSYGKFNIKKVITSTNPNYIYEVMFRIGREIRIKIEEENKMSTNIKRDYSKIFVGGTTMKIKDVIFNDPATIILWSDGSKTVVKAGEDDVFDPEKGLAMAISKKVLGNQGNYFEEFKKWLPNNKKKESVKKATINPVDDFSNVMNAPDEGLVCSLKSYCNMYNITKNKAYAMIKKGELKAFKNAIGHWMIVLE